MNKFLKSGCPQYADIEAFGIIVRRPDDLKIIMHRLLWLKENKIQKKEISKAIISSNYFYKNNF